MQSYSNRAWYSLLTITLLLSSGIYAMAIPGVITVTNTNDSGAGSLRQAILDTNSASDTPRIINFSIGSGVKVIQPLSALPSITSSNVIIDATTQPGWSLDNPMIVLDGSLLTPFSVDGLTLSGVNNCVISGLVINNGFNNGILITDAGIGTNLNAVIRCFIGIDYTGTIAKPNFNGITINGSTNFSNQTNTIGGLTSDLGNLISGNNNSGIVLLTNTSGTSIQNNFIGTDINGTSAVPNLNGGISITGSLIPLAAEQCSDNTILSNLISGNSVGGILLFSNANTTFIQTNLIGVDVSGIIALPNDAGIVTQGQVPPDPTNPFNGGISETFVQLSNVISGNNLHGIVIGANTTFSTITNNFIGTDLTGTVALGNGGHGILIQGINNAPSTRNSIGSLNVSPSGANIIAFNGTAVSPAYGILMAGDPVTPDTLNASVQNTIFNNVLSGIGLSNNSDNSQTIPTIVNALLNANGDAITISATAPSIPSDGTFNIDLFINNVDHSPLTEGKIYVGTLFLVPAGTTLVGQFPLTSTVGSDLWVSATTSNLNNFDAPGDTSPFTSNFQMATLPNNLPPFVFPPQ
ncbi:MAG: beta strand repeat-containing protein [Candidatus Babeliales bacterium]